MAGIFVSASSTNLNTGNTCNATPDFTVSARIVRASTGNRHEIISKEGVTATGWEISVLSSDLFEFGNFANPTYYVAVSTTTISSGTQYGVAGRRNNSTGDIDAIVNGVVEGTATGTSASESNTNNLGIGYNPTFSSRYFDGLIYDLCMWDVYLTIEEIAAHHKGIAASKIRPASIIGYVPLLNDARFLRNVNTLSNSGVTFSGTDHRVIFDGTRLTSFKAGAAPPPTPFILSANYENYRRRPVVIAY